MNAERTLFSGVWGRWSWARSMKRRPRTPIGWLRLAWHDFVVHGLLDCGGERCQDCGRDYVLWRAPDDLYEQVHGTAAGLLCPMCFDHQALKQGISVEFQAVRR